MPIICQQCGRQNPDGADFCVNKECGAYLDWQSQQLQRPPDAPVAGPRPPASADPRAGAAEQEAGARVAVAEQSLTVEPGSTATTTVTVHNSGTRVENFWLEVQGPAASWATLEPESVPVYPGSEAESTLRFAPPRSEAAPAGPAWYVVRATSTIHPALQVGVDGTLDVAPFRGIDAELTPRSTRGRFGTTHTVRITNQGNVVEPIAVSARDPEELLQFTVPDEEIHVQPGVVQVDVPVRAPRRLIGRPKTHPFQVDVTPRPTLAPIRLDGSRDLIPLVARWVPIAAAAVLLVAVLSPFIPRFLSSEDEPTPAAAAASPPAEQPSETPPPETKPPETQPPADGTEAEPAPPPPPPPVEPEPPKEPVPAQPPTTGTLQLEVSGMDRADLDKGKATNKEEDKSVDVRFGEESTTERFIEPVNGALLASFGPMKPTVEKCTKNLSTDKVDRFPIDKTSSGSYLCVQTNEGGVSVVGLEELTGFNDEILKISFTTFAKK